MTVPPIVQFILILKPYNIMSYYHIAYTHEISMQETITYANAM